MKYMHESKTCCTVGIFDEIKNKEGEFPIDSVYACLYWLCSCLRLLNWSFVFPLVLSVGVHTYTESSKYNEGVIKNNTKVNYLPCVFTALKYFVGRLCGRALSFAIQSFGLLFLC